MTGFTVHGDQTKTVSGRKRFGDAVTVQGGVPPGEPGGTLIVAGLLQTNGVLDIQGGEASCGSGTAPGQGGMASITGSLVVQNLLTIEAGQPGVEPGQAGTLSITDSGAVLIGGGTTSKQHGSAAHDAGTFTADGVILNAGALSFGGGEGGSLYAGQAAASGAQATLSGVLTNTGTLDVGGGLASNASRPLSDGGYYDGGSGASLTVTGVLINSGTLAIAGGQGGRGYYSCPAGGGLLTVDGVLTNTGSLLIGAGGAGVGGYSLGGGGGTLDDLGTVTNSGQITLAGAPGARVATGHYSYHNLGPHPGGHSLLEVSSLLTNTGTITIDGGLVSADQYGCVGGYLVVDGTMVNTGVINIGDGIGYDSGGGLLLVQGVLTDSGAIRTIGASGYNSNYRQPEIMVLSGGALNLDGGTISGGGTLKVAGSLVGNGTIDITRLENTGFFGIGTITASGGTLLIASEILNGGSFPGLLDADSGATLELTGEIEGPVPVTLAQGATLETTAADAKLLVRSPLGGTLTIIGGGTAKINSGDTNLTVQLGQATNLMLSAMGFITANGSTDHDSITAMSSGQTLTGGDGQDLLTGALATGDVFRDTAAGLNGDAIADFAGSDALDITDIASGPGLFVTYTQAGAQGLLAVSNGSVATTITLQGSFTTSLFSTASDNHGGVQITLHG